MNVQLNSPVLKHNKTSVTLFVIICNLLLTSTVIICLSQFGAVITEYPQMVICEEYKFMSYGSTD